MADHLPLADVGDLDEHLIPGVRVGNDVLVVAPLHDHLLAIGDSLDRLQLVAVASRIFEVKPPRGALHAVLELVHQHIGSPFHEQRHLVDPRLVVLRADAPLARSRAALDVEVEAHLALLEDLVGAGPEWQQLPDRFDSASERLRGGVRAEVERPVLEHPP